MNKFGNDAAPFADLRGNGGFDFGENDRCFCEWWGSVAGIPNTLLVPYRDFLQVFRTKKRLKNTTNAFPRRVPIGQTPGAQIK